MRNDDLFDLEYDERKRKQEQQRKENEKKEQTDGTQDLNYEDLSSDQFKFDEKEYLSYFGKEQEKKVEEKPVDKDIFTSGNVKSENKSNVKSNGISSSVKEKIRETQENINAKNTSYTNKKTSTNGAGVVMFGMIVFISSFFLIVFSVLADEDGSIAPIIFIIVFFVFILTFILVLTAKQKAQLMKPTADCIRKNAVVISSVKSSETNSVRGNTIVYKVKLKVDDREVSTYCKTYLQEGKGVVVYLKKDSYDYCYIAVDESIN